MTNQAINENSIDDFTQDELQIISDAVKHYRDEISRRSSSIAPFQKIFEQHLLETKHLHEKILTFINI